MTSKERVRLTMQHKKTDIIPAAFQSVDCVKERLIKEYGFNDVEQLYQKFNIDIRYAEPKYIGPNLPSRTLPNGNEVTTSFWGYEEEHHSFELAQYATTITFPFNDETTLEDIENYNWPTTDWFDYSPITKACEEHPDKAIVIGHEGAFQQVTYLIKMDEFFILMLEEPEIAHSILDHMVNFELAHYKKMFEAGHGKVDILRLHDDYGTQISMLFSKELWEEFFSSNLKKLVNLTHSYNAFYQQHSCGAIGGLIPNFIECGVDSLEPLQPVDTLHIDDLKKYYGRIVFHGGIDTQELLPNGTKEEVLAETQKYVNALKGDYILMASQEFEGDVPTANIEAVYSVDRSL